MGRLPDRLADCELRRLHRVKQLPPPADLSLGPCMVSFFKQSVEKRHRRLGKLAEAFARLIPEPMQEHCCLESLARGTLVILVDSASHLYDLKHLLLGGLEKQLKAQCPGSGLMRITLRRGQWYRGEDPRDRRPSFPE